MHAFVEVFGGIALTSYDVQGISLWDMKFQMITELPSLQIILRQHDSMAMHYHITERSVYNENGPRTNNHACGRVAQQNQLPGRKEPPKHI